MKAFLAKLMLIVGLLIFGGATAELADHIGLPLWRRRQDKKHSEERAIEMFELKRRYL